MENFLRCCEYFGIVNLRLTKLAVRIPSPPQGQSGSDEERARERRPMRQRPNRASLESLLLLSEPIATMNRCYARGLTAVPPPLPEGEGRGEGEFRRPRPYGSSKGGP